LRTRPFVVLTSVAGIVGVVMLITSFSINPGPPAAATNEQLVAFGNQYYASILWGAWLQAVGPLLIVLFAFAIVFLAGATTRLSGWMTLFGGGILMMVSLTEVTFYITALYGDSPAAVGLVSLDLIHAVQHLYFIVGAPALFIPLGAVILGSRVLPRAFGYSALLLGVAFAALGVALLYSLTFAPSGAGVRRSPGLLVVNCGRHVDNPLRKDYAFSGRLKRPGGGATVR
jgi:hypothetical protein